MIHLYKRLSEAISTFVIRYSAVRRYRHPVLGDGMAVFREPIFSETRLLQPCMCHRVH